MAKLTADRHLQVIFVTGEKDGVVILWLIRC